MSRLTGRPQAHARLCRLRRPPLARDQAPDLAQAQSFAGEIRTAHPGKWLVYNLSPSFNWGAHGFSKEQLKSFVWDLGKAGFAIQLISLAGLHSTAVTTGASHLAFSACAALSCAWSLRAREGLAARKTGPLTCLSRRARSRARGAVQDPGHARLRRAHPAEGEGHCLRRLHPPKVVGRVLQRPRAQWCVRCRRSRGWMKQLADGIEPSLCSGRGWLFGDGGGRQGLDRAFVLVPSADTVAKRTPIPQCGTTRLVVRELRSTWLRQQTLPEKALASGSLRTLSRPRWSLEQVVMSCAHDRARVESLHAAGAPRVHNVSVDGRCSRLARLRDLRSLLLALPIRYRTSVFAHAPPLSPCTRPSCAPHPASGSPHTSQSCPAPGPFSNVQCGHTLTPPASAPPPPPAPPAPAAAPAPARRRRRQQREGRRRRAGCRTRRASASAAAAGCRQRRGSPSQAAGGLRCVRWRQLRLSA